MHDVSDGSSSWATTERSTSVEARDGSASDRGGGDSSDVHDDSEEDEADVDEERPRRTGRKVPFWSGAAIAITVVVALAYAWYAPVNTSHELVDSVGRGSPVLHKSRAVFDGTVNTRPLSAVGTACYRASMLAGAVGVLPQLAV